VAAQVWRHRPPPLDGQAVHPVGKVLLGPGEAVDQQQRSAAPAGLGHRQIDRSDPDGGDLHLVAARQDGWIEVADLRRIWDLDVDRLVEVVELHRDGHGCVTELGNFL